MGLISDTINLSYCLINIVDISPHIHPTPFTILQFCLILEPNCYTLTWMIILPKALHENQILLFDNRHVLIVFGQCIIQIINYRKQLKPIIKP